MELMALRDQSMWNYNSCKKQFWPSMFYAAPAPIHTCISSTKHLIYDTIVKGSEGQNIYSEEAHYLFKLYIII